MFSAEISAPAHQKHNPNRAAFRAIFDGKTMTGWDGDPAHWRIEGGAFVGETTAERPLTQGNTFLSWQAGGAQITDFEKEPSPPRRM
jgi:hypothetical protein